MKLTVASASKVTFGYSTDECEDVSIDFIVNTEYLWSANGMVKLFNDCRIAFLGDKSEDPTEPWESWHLVSAQESTDCFVLVEDDDRLLTSISA